MMLPKSHLTCTSWLEKSTRLKVARTCEDQWSSDVKCDKKRFQHIVGLKVPEILGNLGHHLDSETVPGFIS